MAQRDLHLVAVLTTPEKGGAEYACVDLLSGMAERGHAVRLLTDLPELARSSPVSVAEIHIGPKLARRTVGRVVRGFVPWMIRLAGALRRERRRTGPVDVLLLNFKKEQLMGALLPTALTGAVVWAEWGPLPAEFSAGLPNRLYRLAAHRAEAILAVSESTRRSLVDAGLPAAKIQVVPNRVDTTTVAFDAVERGRLRAEWGADESTFVVGCIGRLHAKKRAHVLIEAITFMQAVKDEGEVLLVLAGEGEEEPALRRLAEDLSVAVRFVATPRGNVQSVLSAFDVALFAPAPTEGAPQSIVLAQLTGRPVIATDRPGAEELIVPGTGMIAEPPQNPRAVASCLEVYRRDSDRRDREGRAARRYAVARHDRTRIDPEVERVLAAATAARHSTSRSTPKP
jgi:glycosyltransferase involved in cell wall biosynthesis